jgi:hypothetical protein
MVGLSWYTTLESLTTQEWLEYLVVFVFVMFVITRIIQPTALQLVALLIALIVIYYRMDKRKTVTANSYDELEYRLKSLYPKPENFQMDADLINLFYNIKDFRNYNSDGYDQSLVACDNMLKLKSEVEAGVFHCKENLDVIKEEMNKALNHFHTIVYKLPAQLYLMEKHQRSINALHVILRKHIDDVVMMCRKHYKDRPLDIDYHEIHNSGPRPDDTQQADFSNFNFYY